MTSMESVHSIIIRYWPCTLRSHIRTVGAWSGPNERILNSCDFSKLIKIYPQNGTNSLRLSLHSIPMVALKRQMTLGWAIKMCQQLTVRHFLKVEPAQGDMKLTYCLKVAVSNRFTQNTVDVKAAGSFILQRKTHTPLWKPTVKIKPY